MKYLLVVVFLVSSCHVFGQTVKELRESPLKRVPDSYRNGNDVPKLNSNNGNWNGRNGGWRNGGWRNGGASTAFGSYARGLADIKRAEGQRAESFARAATQMQDAKRRAILNDNLYIEQYFERQRMNRLYRAAKRRSPSTPEQSARLAKVGIPADLADKHLNRETGEIVWPEVLQLEVFALHVDTLNQLYAIRYGSENQSGIGSTNHRWVKRIGDDMLIDLRKHMQEIHMNANEYIYAKKFIVSLVNESARVVE